MIYTGVNDDCETENGEEEEDRKKEAKKTGSEYKASRWDEKRSVSFFLLCLSSELLLPSSIFSYSDRIVLATL